MSNAYNENKNESETTMIFKILFWNFGAIKYCRALTRYTFRNYYSNLFRFFMFQKKK